MNTSEEMFRIFNMGIGLIVACAPRDAERVVNTVSLAGGTVVAAESSGSNSSTDPSGWFSRLEYTSQAARGRARPASADPSAVPTAAARRTMGSAPCEKRIDG